MAFAETNIKTDSQTKEVLFYKDALWHGYQALPQDKRLLTTPLFEELAQIVTNNTEGVRKLTGTRLQNPQNKEIIYTPPEGKTTIRNKLSNLKKFIYNNEDLDP